MQLASGKRHDVAILKVGPWVAGNLPILDLAYRKGLLYQQIADNEATSCSEERRQTIR